MANIWYLYCRMHLHDSIVISMLECQPRGMGFKSLPGTDSYSKISVLPVRPSEIGCKMCALAIHFLWIVQVVRKGTCQPLSKCKVKKIRLLTLCSHDCSFVRYLKCNKYC